MKEHILIEWVVLNSGGRKVYQRNEIEEVNSNDRHRKESVNLYEILHKKAMFRINVFVFVLLISFFSSF